MGREEEEDSSFSMVFQKRIGIVFFLLLVVSSFFLVNGTNITNSTDNTTIPFLSNTTPANFSLNSSQVMNSTPFKETIVITNLTVNVTTNSTDLSLNRSDVKKENYYRLYRDIKNTYYKNASEEFTVELEVPESLLLLNNSEINNESNYTFSMKMEFEDLPVMSIDFRNLSLNNDSIELGIEELNFSDYVQSYAIDPERMEFDNATVTVVAKGTALHKCALWNFSEQRCDGPIIKLMDTIPGEEYTFILTPKDPAFFESVPDTNNDARAVDGVLELNNVLRIGNDAGTIYDSYFRFETIQIPQNSTIINAYLNFTSTSTQSGVTVNADILGLREANCNQFNTGAGGDDPTDNTRTTAQVNWDSIVAWTDLENSVNTTTPNISSIVQEIVNLSGWVSNNSLCFVLEDDGSSSSAFREIATTSETEAQLFVQFSVSQDSWWDLEFQSRKEISINNTGSSTLVNFPIFLDIDYATGMQTDYDDLRFVNGTCDSVGTKIQLNHELETSNSTNAAIWLKMQSFEVGSNSICMYYNNESVSSGENGPGVWDQYDGVWHFSETGTGDRLDSTGAGNDAAPVGFDGDEGVTGVLGGADYFDGNAEYMAIRNLQYNTASGINGTTVCALITSDDSISQQIIASFDRNEHWRFSLRDDGGSNNVAWDTDNTGVTNDFDSTDSFTDGNWHYICGWFNTSSTPDKQIYVDGESVENTNGHAGNMGSATTRFGFIGVGSEATTFNGSIGPTLYLNATIDELRISNVSRSTDWINQTYQLIINQDTFVSQSSSETLGKIQIDLLVPSTPTNTEVSKDEFFTTSFNVSCNSPIDCGDYNLTLYHNASLSLGESGSISFINFESQLIPFERGYTQTPIVIAVPVTDTDADNNALIPVFNTINETHLNMSLCEDAGASSCSSIVENETVHYFVFDQELANTYPWIEVGTVTGTTNGGNTAVLFNKTFASTPYIFASVQSPNDGGDDIAPTMWAHSTSTTGTTLIGCEHPGTANACGAGSSEELGYVAIDVNDNGFLTFVSGTEAIDDSLWTAITYGQTIDIPRIMVLENSDNGAQDPQYPWARSVTSTGADIRYCEQDGAGDCDTHAAEDVMWVVMEEGLLTINESGFVPVSTVTGTTPFYTTSSNPQSGQLNASQSNTVSFTVNATGQLGDQYEFYASTNATTISPFFNITILGDPEVYWNESNISFTDAFFNDTVVDINTSLLSINVNNNVTVSCASGNCSQITTNFSNGITMNNLGEETVHFSCDSSSVGFLTARFNVISNDDSTPDQIDVNCNVSLKPIDIVLDDPSPGSLVEVIQNQTTSVSFNVTCNNESGCNNIDVTLVYETEVPVGETGQVTLGSTESTLITFQQTYTETPVLIAIPASDNNADDNSFIPLIFEINTTHANVSFCRDAGVATCSTSTSDEDMHYFVFDPAVANTYSWIEVGKVDVTTNGVGTGVTFNKTFAASPFVFAMAQTDNDGGNAIAPTAWPVSISTTGASIVGCDHPGIVDTCAGSSTETFGYVAIDVANHNLINFSSGTVSVGNSAWTAITYGQTYTTPRVMTMQREEAGAQDPQYPMARNIGATTAEVRYCEQDGAGDCDTHNAENMQWFILETGTIKVNEISSSIVSTIVGATPLFTPSSNPQTISLNTSSSALVTFTVNATGIINETYNLSGLLDNGEQSDRFVLRIVGAPQLVFANESTNFSTGFVGEDQVDVQVNLTSIYANSNISFFCLSGNCSDINVTTSFPFNMIDEEVKQINFICTNRTSANYSAVYQVNSTQDPDGDTLNLSCTVLTKDLDIDVINPLAESFTEVVQNTTINMSFDVSCNATGSCGTFDVTLYFINDTSFGEAGTVSLTGTQSTLVEFVRNYEDPPVVIVTPATDNAGDNNALIGAVNFVNTTHVNISICKDAGAATCTSVGTSESIDYIVFDKDAGDLYSWIEVGTVTGTTNGGNTAVSFNKTFSAIPYLFTSVQTDNDGTTSISPTTWSHSISTTAATIIGCEHPATADACGTGRSETIGYVAIDVANHNISGIDFGTESIVDSTWTIVNFAQNYTNPRMMVSENSDNGAQDPQYPLARGITSSSAQVRYCEQDGAGDCDTHTNEDVRWFVIEEGLLKTPGDTSAPVSTLVGDSPFFTTDSNPVQLTLNSGESARIYFIVNATGPTGQTFEFFAETNTSEESEHYFITIENLLDLFQIYFGNLNREILLAQEQELFYVFGTNRDTAIYAYDADANITWENLTGIGRTSTGSASTNDFSEIDTFFNHSNNVYGETVQQRFASDPSTPLHVKNMTLFGRLVENVPITNSTTVEAFQTGILWDASDDLGNNEFDITDIEDIIFVTLVNESQVGTYGTYDYELLVPETLGNQVNTTLNVTFRTD